MPAKKYFKEEFDRVFNEEFHGDVHAMRASSEYNLRLHKTASLRGWVKPLTRSEIHAKYSKEEFLRILGSFGGSMYDMRRSSDRNRRMCVMAVIHRWIDPVNCIGSGGRGRGYTTYVASFNPTAGNGISVYVGITLRPPEKRFCEHMSSLHDSSIRRFADSNGGAMPKFTVMSSRLTRQEAVDEERRLIEHYRLMGWNVLNRSNGGEIGGCPWKDTLEYARKVSSGFATYGEFRASAYYNKIWHKAKSDPKWNDLLKETYARFGRTPRNFQIGNLTYEECIERARKFKNREEMFKYDKNALIYIYKKGMLKRIADEAGWPKIREYRPMMPFTCKQTNGGTETRSFSMIKDAVKFLRVTFKTVTSALDSDPSDYNAHIVKGYHVSYDNGYVWKQGR